MDMIEIYAIQKYYGRADNGTDWFIWDIIKVPKCKEHNVHIMNRIIPIIFKLPEEKRTKLIDGIVLMDNNNGVNQYFPFLKDYASQPVSKFILETRL